MRVEEASAFISCKESKLAKKIYLDSKNELREIALMGKDGEWIFAGSDNNPELKRKVDLVFAGGSKKDHPCLTNPAPSSKASEQ